jgi:hypothetical protein
MKYGLQYDKEKHDIIYVEDGIKKARMKCGCVIYTSSSKKGSVPMDDVLKQFRQARVELWKIPENVTLGCPRLTLSNGELQKDCFGGLEISHLPMEILNKPVSHYKVEVSNGMLLLVDSILGVSYNLRELSLHGWELAHPNGFRENSGNITRYIHVNAVVRNNKLKVDVDKVAIAEAQKKADAITKDWQAMVKSFQTAMLNAALEERRKK